MDIKRVLELGRPAEGKLARLRESAEQAAAGYSLVSWTGPVPDEFIEQAAALYTALNDAPHGPEYKPQAWDAQRVRERINEYRGRYGMHEYSIAARHDTSGELAALTEMVVDTADPGWGHQEHMIAVNETLGYTILRAAEHFVPAGRGDCARLSAAGGASRGRRS